MSTHDHSCIFHLVIQVPILWSDFLSLNLCTNKIEHFPRKLISQVLQVHSKCPCAEFKLEPYNLTKSLHLTEKLYSLELIAVKF